MIKVTRPVVTTSGGQIEVSAEIDSHPFYVRWNGDREPSAVALGNAMLCFALIPALAQGRDLEIDAPVSARLLYQAGPIQDTLIRWFPDRFKSRIKVTTEETTTPTARPAAGSGTFFTGGIDSMFTLMLERETLSHTIYVHGFDIKLDDSGHRQLTATNLKAASAAAGVGLIEVETNLRHYTDQFTNWLLDFIGAALAGVGHLLSGDLGHVFIPASNRYESLPFIGTDPLLDPRFQSDHLAITHHGADQSRIEKSAAVADWEVAQKHLRVCWQNLDGQLNCGQCEKCARTLVGLEVLGIRDAFVANFANPVSTEEAMKLEIVPDPGKWADWQAIQEIAVAGGKHPKVVSALEQKFSTADNEQLTRQLRANLNGTIDSSHWHERLPKFRNKILKSMAESDPEWLEQRIRKNLPELRQALARELAADPNWLKKKIRSATWKKRLRR